MTGLAYKNRRASLASTCLAVQPRPHYVHFANSTALVDEETDLRSMGGIVPQEGPGTFTLQCVPLYTLLLALGNPTVNWFILDIEGSEWTVLTDLMDSGALCAVDGVFVEYHDADFERIGAQAGSLRRAALATMRDAVRSLRAAISPALRGEGSCPARVVDLDDETFVRDPAPWPGGSVCSK